MPGSGCESVRRPSLGGVVAAGIENRKGLIDPRAGEKVRCAGALLWRNSEFEITIGCRRSGGARTQKARGGVQVVLHRGYGRKPPMGSLPPGRREPIRQEQPARIAVIPDA